LLAAGCRSSASFAANHKPNQDAAMPPRGMRTSTWDHIQGFLFPMPREEVGPPAALPLTTVAAERVANLHDLMERTFIVSGKRSPWTVLAARRGGKAASEADVLQEPLPGAYDDY
jgi:hypothetical protein